MRWHCVVAVTSLPSSSLHLALLHIVTPPCTRVSAGATPPLAVGRDIKVAVLWHGQLGRGTVQAALLSLRFSLSPGPRHAAHLLC